MTALRTRLGILGGTFDPVHGGHLELARRMLDALGLSSVRFVPALAAPHKPTPPVADGWHRVAMLALATVDESGFQLSTGEMHLGRATYTIETLSMLRSELPAETELFFLLGADMLAEIQTWRNFPGLLERSNFAALSRPGHNLGIDHLPDWAKSRVEELHGCLGPRNPGPNKIFLCTGAANPTTSTEVRARVSRGESLEGYVPGAVERYIHKQRLYLEADDAEANTTATVVHPADRPVRAHGR